MAVKKAPVAVVATEKVAVSLSKASSAMSDAVASVNKVVKEQLEGLDDKLVTLGEQIAQKEEAIAALTLELQEKRRQEDLDFKLKLKEDQEAVIYEILGEKGLIAVKDTEFTELKGLVGKHPTLLEDAIKAAEGKAFGMAKAAHAKDIELLNANFKADQAGNAAQITSLLKEVEVYKAQSSMLQKQLEAERTASVDRAKAGAIGTIQVGDTSTGRR